MVCMVGTGLPPQEPNEVCEACGAQGTVGRAMRTDQSGAPTETHRFCAACWPEHSARYRARWEEERRLVTDAWFRAPRAARPPSGGMGFESATWHATLEFVRDIRRASQELDGRQLAGLGRLAREMAAGAADRVGDMPWEVETFIREHEGDANEGDANDDDPTDPETRRERHRTDSIEVMREAELYSSAALAALDDALNSKASTDERALLARIEQCVNPAAMLPVLEREATELQPHIEELRRTVATERKASEDWERRAMLAVKEGRDDLARQALVRFGQHHQAAEHIEAELGECVALERQYRDAILQVRARLG